MNRYRILYSIALLLGIVLLFLPKNTSAAALEDTDLPVGGRDTDVRVTRVLILGVDRSAHLTDSMMVVTVNETNREVSVVQIPRDTYANYTDRSYKKLNGLLREKGEKATKVFLSRALGVSLDYFFILDLDCLDALVDAVGGIDLEIPQDMFYSDPSQDLEIHLPKGPHHLNGEQAEHFVRYRAGYANADLGRLDAQKQFLRAVAKRCNTLTAPELLRMVGCTLTRLQTDMDLPTVIRMVGLFGKINAEEIRMETLAGRAVQGRSGAWYYSLNKEGCVRMINQLLCPQTEINEALFDPDQVFDRPGHKDFHKIYASPEDQLPPG